jgi:16S rRNA (cytidine1402-2'-O)-methyltransferase
VTGPPRPGPRGRLVVVGTPIGNLGDLSPRAVEALAAADVVACEDTRRTGRLLGHAGITAPHLVRVDAHTESERAGGLLDRVAAGGVVALVSDAGMPGLSDPGGAVVAAARERGLEVEVVPGPFAGAVALVSSGLLGADGRFTFEGFLPRSGSGRSRRLDALREEQRVVVLYEAPHRLERTLGDLVGVCGTDRPVALCRELTKLHEETWRGTLAEAVTHVADVVPRGEYVVVLAAGAPPPAPGDDDVRAALADALAGGATRRDAASAVAAALDVPVNRVKRLLTGGGTPST